jgi:hypothetical protein
LYRGLRAASYWIHKKRGRGESNTSRHSDPSLEEETMLTNSRFAARAGVRARLVKAFAACLSLGFSCAALPHLAYGQAQTPAPVAPAAAAPQPAPVLVTDSFTGVVIDPAKPPATVTAYRTGNLSAGDSFSGTVSSDATDTSELSGLVYQVVAKDPSGNQTVVSQAPVSNGVYKGLIPAAAVVGGGVLVGELLENGKQVGTGTPVSIETPTGVTSQPTLTSDSYKIPTLMQAGKPTAIAFQGGDGDLTTTHVTVGGQPAQELAEGPEGTVFRSPTGVTGPTSVTISKNGVTGSGESRNVAVSLSAGSKTLSTGTAEMVTGKVSGLTGLEKPLSLTLQNNTPAVTLQGGNTQEVTIAPTNVLADGTYSFERDITAGHPGIFDVTATLEGLSIPGPNISETPAGPVIAGNGGAKQGQGNCEDCGVASNNGQGGPAPLILLTVAPPQNSTTSHPHFQDLYGGTTVVFDATDPDKPRFAGSYPDSAIASELKQNHWPDFIQCIPATGDHQTVSVGGPPGTTSLPGNYPSPGFDGSRGGGCGTWSTAVCNRILGDTDPNKPVDQVEWNGIAKGIKQDPNGGSLPQNIDKYYRDKGYCVETKVYGGTTADQSELGKKFVSDHCDVKLAFLAANPTPPPAFINGHVETVTGITSRGIQTNSWGTDGYVQGGTNGGFSHSNPHFAGLWPPGSTAVIVSYVCKCSFFDALF